MYDCPVIRAKKALLPGLNDLSLTVFRKTDGSEVFLKS